MAIVRHAYALSSGNNLVSFNPAIPSVGISIPVTGLLPGQTLVGIDVRPANGVLYSLGVSGTDTATLYTISPLTGVATIVGAFAVGGISFASGFGFDFNSVADRIRVTTDTNLNFRINPDTGLLAGLDPQIFGSFDITGAAHTNNETNNGGVSTLYTLDSLSNSLMIQGGLGGTPSPNGGIQTLVGLVGVDFSTANGFDIPPGVDTGVPGAGLALLTTTVGGTTGLYSINLGTGAGTLIGNFLNGTTPANGLAIQNTPPAADFNGDNPSDFLWQNDSGQAAVWLLNGTSVVGGDLVGPNVGPSWHLKGDGDFNADGRSDFLWQDDSGQAAVWLMKGTAQIGGNLVGPNPGPSWHVIDSGDFNGDGRSDILWQDDSGQAALWLMNGTNMIGSGLVGPNPGQSWHVIASGDFNGDFWNDILWQNDSGQAAVWLMKGTNMIGSGLVGPNPGPSWHVIDAGDFNGDGKDDILWQDNSGQAAIWLVNGTSVNGSGLVGPNPGPSWHVIGSGDFNGDRHSDILWQNDSGQAAVWQMNGTSLIGSGLVGGSPGADWDLIA
jgi:Domain of unknown function (DUF4394)/FG-GAP-like repeat